MAKSAADWNAAPKFPATHYVDSRIYTDPQIFAEELDKLFRPSWIIACHESEIPGAYDYRLFAHPAGVPLIISEADRPPRRAAYAYRCCGSPVSQKAIFRRSSSTSSARRPEKRSLSGKENGG